MNKRGEQNLMIAQWKKKVFKFQDGIYTDILRNEEYKDAKYRTEMMPLETLKAVKGAEALLAILAFHYCLWELAWVYVC